VTIDATIVFTYGLEGEHSMVGFLGLELY